MSRVYLAGSGSFGHRALETIQDAGHTVVGVCSPPEGRHGGRDALALTAARLELPWTDVAVLRPEAVPDHTDVILTAHSHAFIGARTRARARYALGYHPSLLPLHRGRDAVKWQARLNERVVGGTIYHLTNRVDGGPIAYQRHVIVPPHLDASTLWSRYLFDLGLDLIQEALDGVTRGAVPVLPQNDALATWEPSFTTEPLHRPELLELEAPRRP